MTAAKVHGTIDRGQYDRRIPSSSPGFANGGSVYGGFTGIQKPSSISISLEFLRGVETAAQWAHDNYDEPNATDIYGAVASGEVDRLRGEVAK